MDVPQTPADLPQAPVSLDGAEFQRVWRRVMPQDRPDCPFVLNEDPAPLVPLPQGAPPPQARGPALCLGEESVGDLPALTGLAETVAGHLALYRRLARRRELTGQARVMAAMKADHLSRLETARFLIAGEPPLPLPSAPPPAGAPSALLRLRFHDEQALVLRLFTAARAAADPCLTELYRDLAAETQAGADRLRTWLEEQVRRSLSPSGRS